MLYYRHRLGRGPNNELGYRSHFDNVEQGFLSIQEQFA